MAQKYFVFFFITCFLFAQVKTDKPISSCGNALSATRWLGTQSSLNENQDKIDVTYYRIEFEIDLDVEEIKGSVLANGWIGMDQPDSIELDFSEAMVVDSVKFYNESVDRVFKVKYTFCTELRFIF